MKKFVALLAVFCLLLGSVSVVAFAEDEEEIKDVSVDVICEAAGDIDLDGKISSADSRLALRYAVGLEDFANLPEGAFVRADTDADGKVKAADSRLILRIAVELDEQPGHLYTVEKVKEEALKAAADCTKAAEYYYTCATCGDVEKDDEHTFTDGAALGHDYQDANVDATWTVKGETKKVCSRCKDVQDKAEVATKIEDMIADANEWAENAGLDCLIAGEADGAEIKLLINVDGIWAYDGVEADAFDGFLTKIGEYVKENIGDIEISLDGNTVYEKGALKNHAVKVALFDIGDGFFYKIANLADDGVYGEYDLIVDGEEAKLSVVFEGDAANIAKVKSFAETISEHVYAVKGDDLVIGVEIPDALAAKIEAAGQSRLINATVGECLDKLADMDLADVLGSEVSAVNKLVTLLCDDGVAAFANKVLGKFSDVTCNGIDALSGEAYAPAEASFNGFVNAVKAMFSEALLGEKINEFTYVGGADNAQFKTGFYEIPVSFKVNVGNADLMENGVIEETIVFRIHYQLEEG